jgi:hypothetical protein
MNNKNPRADSRRRKSVQLLAALVVLLLSTAPAAAQDAPKIQWELVNPFRFISDRDSVDELRRVYDGLPQQEQTAFGLERALQQLSEKEVSDFRAAERERLKCDAKPSEKERNRCIEGTKKPYLGWFARLAADNYRKTCWDAERQQFRDEGGCKDYVSPKTHRVRVWLTDTQTSGGRVPQQWLVDNQPPPKVDNCAAKYQKNFCAEFELADDISQPKARTLAVRFSDGSLMTAPDKMLVRDVLVVGLGDSYAAGEGNPDIPAQFTQGNADPDFLLAFKYFLTNFKLRMAPRKDNGAEVGWLDRRCHRSMYSYQFKTALQLALADPRRAVTYVSYSCSGATTDEIFKERQKPNEGEGRVTQQLESLRRLLGGGASKPREIDYLLLSTGGNDIGFGKFVAYVVTSGWARGLIAHGVDEKKLRENREKIREKLLSGKGQDVGNYPELHAALLDEAQGVRIKDCRANRPCPRVLLTPYPDIFNDENGTLCKAERQEFDIPFKPDHTRAERLEWVKQYIFTPLREVQTDPLITSQTGLGWTLVESQLGEYLRHGFCARNAQSTSPTGEQFVMPTREHGKWGPFDPRDYRSYETRQRWIRLPVDSKLTTDQVHVILKKFSLDIFLEDDRSNIMHPTAEALAKTADANFKVIQRLEGKAN